jgi:hypothetical protein
MGAEPVDGCAKPAGIEACAIHRTQADALKSPIRTADLMAFLLVVPGVVSGFGG